MLPFRPIPPRRLVLALAMVLGFLPSPAQEVLKLPSKLLGEERTLLVSMPPAYAASQDRFPVLLLTDGDAHIAHTRATVDFLARNGLIPNLIVVGVIHANRTRDLTPTAGSFRGEDGRLQPVPDSGGGPRFLEFLAQEALPAVDARYRTSPFRIFAGHSLGGLFALNVLSARPELFQGVIAVSPSLNWDEDQPLRALDAALKGRKDLQRTLFVSMANEEDGAPRPNRLDRLRSLLKARQPARFTWEVRHLPDEDHGSVVLASHYWGLRRIFDGWRLGGINGRFDGGLEELKAHYARLSERLGIQVAPPELAVNLAGYQALQRGRGRDAVDIFRYNLHLYPGSANAHDSLAEALERAGRQAEALELYRRAVNLAEQAGDPRAPLFRLNRERLAAQLAKRP